MTTHVAALALAAALLAPGGGMPAQLAAVADELAKGKQQVAQGKYEEGVATLTGVVSRLPWTGARDPEAASAFLYLGLAYAGLGEVSPATSQFLQALRRDPAISPDPRTTPSASLEIFAAAVKEAEAIGLIRADGGKKRGPGAKLAIGAGALLAGGAAIVAGGTVSDREGRGSAPSIANLAVGVIRSVDGSVGVVPVEFDFQDPDGDIVAVVVEVNGQGVARNPLQEAAGKTGGHARLSQTVRVPPRGVEVGLTVSVSDSRGRLSNPLRGVTVWP